MTSAKYLSNLGQEKAKALREKLKDPEFINVGIQRIGDTSPTPMSLGMTSEALKEIPEVLKEIAQMDAFSAYIMEVIKDKDNSISEIVKTSIEDWSTQFGKNYPEPLGYLEWLKAESIEEPQYTVFRPVSPEPEETDIRVLIGRKSIEEYQKYWELNSLCAVLGKYCHDSEAPLVEARADYLKKLTKPLEKEGEGQGIVVYSYNPSVLKEDLEGVFEALQREYRETEAKLNKIRFDLKEEEAQRVLVETGKYQEALQEYQAATKEVDDERRELRERWALYRKGILEEQKRLTSEFQAWKISERNRVSKLKIVIPPGLTSTYQYLESLGKVDKD